MKNLPIRTIRHKLTKIGAVKYPLTWLQHRGLTAADVLIASYPRAGSTWLRFMLFEILTKQSADFESVDKVIAGVGKHFSSPALLPGNGRLLQTHEPYRVEYKKAVYLVRDVRDVIVSEYYFCQRLEFHKDGFENFFHKFLLGQVNKYGFWADHVSSWLDAYNATSIPILLIKFENMRQDPEGTLLEILSFLGVKSDPLVVRRAIENNTVKKMQKKEDKSAKFSNNSNGIRFISKGGVGNGKQFLSAQQLKHLEQLTEKVLVRLAY